jgi:hypothetical protein
MLTAGSLHRSERSSLVPRGTTTRTFRDPEGSNRVGLIVEVPSISVWEEALQTRRPLRQ